MKNVLLIFLVCLPAWLKADHLLVPMDNAQANHLKAYGIAYWVLEHEVDVEWLLNYRGGSFLFRHTQKFENEMRIRGVSFERITDGRTNEILAYITSETVNMDAVKLEVPPKVAVYSPRTKRPWDDAVTLALTFAEIPYEVVYDPEVLEGKLSEYDWLHLHHEDFTGQYGKFIPRRTNASWFREEVQSQEGTARMFGYKKVSQLKLAVAKTIKDFVANGGFLFAMCSATDTYDIALAAEGVDIVDEVFDHDPMDPAADSKLDFSRTFAFHNFRLVKDAYTYEYSNIDANVRRRVSPNIDYFTLFEFSAKWDPVPTMLCQNHTRTVKGFLGQTTAFKKDKIKPGITIMGELKAFDEARYIHGNLGRGMWTFYGGHDPEDYRHTLNEDPTDLSLHPNSPGYRLILNNILFPAARKKKRKT
ncbi:MAG: asparagine synthetase B [Bacteroidota bacterium]